MRNIALSLIVGLVLGCICTIALMKVIPGWHFPWENIVTHYTNRIYVSYPELVVPDVDTNNGKVCLPQAQWAQIWLDYHSYSTLGFEIFSSNNVLDITHYKTREKYIIPKSIPGHELTVGIGVPLHAMVNYISPIGLGGYAIVKTNEAMAGASYTFRF